MVIKVNVKYRNSFLSSKSSKLLKLEENYLISWIFISYTFLSMMMWISSLCTWCIIFMYMMYHLYVHDVSSLCTWWIIFMYMMYHLYVHDVSSLCTWCIIGDHSQLYFYSFIHFQKHIFPFFINVFLHNQMCYIFYLACYHGVCDDSLNLIILP